MIKLEIQAQDADELKAEMRKLFDGDFSVRAALLRAEKEEKEEGGTECEKRAATVEAVQQLQDLTGGAESFKVEKRVKVKSVSLLEVDPDGEEVSAVQPEDSED